MALDFVMWASHIGEIARQRYRFIVNISNKTIK